MITTLTLLSLLAACDTSDPKDPADDTDVADDTDPADDTDVADDTDPADDTDLPPDPATVPLRGTCTDATRWGRFSIDSSADYGFATGQVSNGVVPVSVLTEVTTDGECTIWRRENPFCDPSCDPGYTCDLTGTCVLYPASQDVGAVTIKGLAEPVSMSPLPPGFSYSDTALPNPPWLDGLAITLTTGGGAYDPVTLHGVGPVSLVPSTLDWLVVQGEDMVLQWDAPAGAARTEVVARLRIDQHGRTPSNIECRFVDDGEGVITAALIDELAALGLTGFPAGDLIRRTTDSAPIGDGCVELLTSSSRRANVEVEGYTPCRTDAMCPPPLTCNELLERCE